MTKCVGKWISQDTTESEYIGVFEFQDLSGEYHDFTIVKTKTHLVFGGACNTGLLESGNFVYDDDFSLDSNLECLLADLESYYNDGPGYQTSDFACNECM